MIEHVIEISVEFIEDETFDVVFDSGGTFAVDFGQYDGTSGDEYGGPFEVTPTSFEQTLNTADKIVRQNITINPIPSNYGLITWNGSTLTVS